MHRESSSIHYAARVAPAKIQRLYELDAQGITDEELIDDVAYAFYARCQSILVVTEAHAGRARCPSCGRVIEHHWKRQEVLRCDPCSWAMTWGEYHASYEGRELHGGNAVEVFREYLTRFPSARTPREKMLLIDWLIHQCHRGAVVRGQQLYTRPVAVNLIEGKLRRIIALLDGLAYGPGSTEGASDAQAAWRQRLFSGIGGWPATRTK